MLALLPIPFLIGFINRLERSAKIRERWIWFAINLGIAALLSLDIYFTLIYMAFCALYTMPPTNAVFSSRHGNPPMREDSKAWQWMQSLALYITAALVDNPKDYPAPNFRWQIFGMVHGAISGLLLMIPTIAMVIYVESGWPVLIALFMCGRGIYDYCFDAIWMDRIMGFILGCFLVISFLAFKYGL